MCVRSAFLCLLLLLLVFSFSDSLCGGQISHDDKFRILCSPEEEAIRRISVAEEIGALAKEDGAIVSRIVHLLRHDARYFLDVSHWKDAGAARAEWLYPAYTLVVAGAPAEISLLEAATESGDTLFNLRATLIIGVIGDVSALPYMIAGLKNKDSQIRAAAARSLGRMKEVGTIPALVQVLRDSDVEVRMTAAEALGGMPDPTGARFLEEALPQSSGLERLIFRLAVCQSGCSVPRKVFLGELSLPEAKTDEVKVMVWYAFRDAMPASYVETVSSNSEAFRVIAAKLLRYSNANGIQEALLGVLDDGDTHLRSAACSSLGRFRNGEVLVALLKGLEDPSWQVQWSALEAIAEIRRESHEQK